MIKHTFVSNIPDDPVSEAAGEILPSHWNADHDLIYSTHLLANYSVTIPSASHSGVWPNIKVRVFKPDGNEVSIYYRQTASEVTIESNVSLQDHTAYIY